MKWVATLFLLFSTSAWALLPGTGNVGSIITNPAANAVLVTTPAIMSGSVNASPSANITVTLWWSCSIAATFEYQVLNTTPAVVSSILLNCPAGTTNSVSIPSISFALPQSWTLRVINLNSFTGTGQASIFWAVDSVN